MIEQIHLSELGLPAAILFCAVALKILGLLLKRYFGRHARNVRAATRILNKLTSIEHDGAKEAFNNN